MTDAFFEIGFEGTSNEDCMVVSKMQGESIIVFDKQKHYGSTLSSLESIKFNKMIRNVKIYKNNSKVLFETNPKFYRSNDEILDFINEKESSGFCDFIPINEHFLILENGKYYKIPYSMSELVDTKYFTFKDRYLVNKFIKTEISVEDLKNSLSDKCKQILLNGIIGDSIDINTKLNEYLHNFENYPFIYPKHGMKDLSELISRINAINGISYILDTTLTVYEFQKLDCNQSDLKTEKPNDGLKITNDIKYECKPGEITDCKCEEDYDVFDRFNTNNENDSDENIDVDKVHTGKLKNKERQCCLDNTGNSSNILCTSRNAFEKDNNSALMASLNSVISSPKPMFYQNNNIKIKVEDITNRNQSLNLNYDNSVLTKKMFNDLGLNFDNLSSYIENGYKYLIRSEHGNIFVKKLYKKELTGSKRYIRIINISFRLLKDRFFAWVYNGYEFIQVFVVDYNSKCCEENTYIVYLVKKGKTFSNKDLDILNIHECDILTDFSFKLYDYKHVSYF